MDLGEPLIAGDACLSPKVDVDCPDNFDVHASLSDLGRKGTSTMHSTTKTFHACDLFNRYSDIDDDETEDVYVNPNDMRLVCCHAYWNKRRCGTSLPLTLLQEAQRAGCARSDQTRLIPITEYPNTRTTNWANIHHLFHGGVPLGTGDRTGRRNARERSRETPRRGGYLFQRWPISSSTTGNVGLSDRCSRSSTTTVRVQASSLLLTSTSCCTKRLGAKGLVRPQMTNSSQGVLDPLRRSPQK